MSKSNDAVLNRLQSIVEKMENDDGFDGIAELRSVFNEIKSEEPEVENYSFEKEKAMEVFGEAVDFRLCRIRQTDKEAYIKLEEENSSMPRAYELEGYGDSLWDDFNEEKAFNVVIRSKSTDSFMGYCGIKNTQKEELELAMTLFKKYQGKGYGPEALHLFMVKVKEITGISEFKALVDGENVHSQKMCEKIGGKPLGITEHLLHDQAYMEEYEQEHAHEVSDVMREVAAKFKVAPEKLLTHVLVYRFRV
ncbi:MAG: GNAT family N-acetyltransferase [Clostridiales bacterium]|nr:GNAT family N-acetyltransferase [Clostridiales bacterium]